VDLERTARSVTEQRDASIEWIVIDGGSTDGSLDVIDAYSESIAYWQSEKDDGIYDAMNKGLARATGDFVLFLNSGDYFISDESLRIVAQAVSQLEQAPGMVLVGASYKFPHGQSMIQMPRRVEDHIYHSTPVTHQAVFFNRRIHQQYPYDTRFRNAGDYECMCQFFLRGESRTYIDRALVFSMRGENSITLNHPWRHAKEAARIQREVLGMGYGSILRSFTRRHMAHIATKMMARRRLAPVTWRIIEAMRPTVDRGLLVPSGPSKTA
jgi:putative colanic acid biosynthesis glycosyltransferase